jgi:enoyl-CoA hydratase/carnithine racemase
MSLIETEIKDDIAIVRLNNGVTNPINTDFCNEFTSALNKIKQIDRLQGLIVTSASTKFFSIGFDLPNLLKCDRDGIYDFYNAFNELCETLLTMPVHTVSAITGHYVAGGTLIAGSTDGRMVVDGRAKTGITAIKLGISVPLLGHMIVKSQMKPEFADEFLTTGDFYEIPWVKESGYIDELTTQEQLMDDAIKWIKDKKINEPPDFKTKKEQVTKEILDEYKKNLEHDRTKFVDSWFDPEVRKNLTAALEKF